MSRPLVELDPTPTTHAVPVGIAMVLLGFFVLVTRRRALSQVVGFLLLDNGIAATAFLVTAGVPVIVELAVSMDLLWWCWSSRCSPRGCVRPSVAPTSTNYGS